MRSNQFKWERKFWGKGLENKIMWKNYRYSPFDNELDWELKVSRSSPLNSPVLKIGPHTLSIKLLIVILVRVKWAYILSKKHTLVLKQSQGPKKRPEHFRVLTGEVCNRDVSIRLHVIKFSRSFTPFSLICTLLQEYEQRKRRACTVSVYEWSEGILAWKKKGTDFRQNS